MLSARSAIGGKSWSLSTKPLAIRLYQLFCNNHEGHPRHLIRPAVFTLPMIALTAIDDVRAARLRRDVVRTVVALMAVPPCWPNPWSLLTTKEWPCNIAQYSTHSISHSTDSVYQFVAVVCRARRPRANNNSDVSSAEWTCWQS